MATSPAIGSPISIIEPAAADLAAVAYDSRVEAISQVMLSFMQTRTQFPLVVDAYKRSHETPQLWATVVRIVGLTKSNYILALAFGRHINARSKSQQLYPSTEKSSDITIAKRCCAQVLASPIGGPKTKVNMAFCSIRLCFF